MPHEIEPGKLPEVKVDSNATWLQAALTADQRRGLWQHPGTSVFAVVRLTAKSFVGHAEGEDKDPVVKVRITSAEAAESNKEAKLVAEVMRAMMRRRSMNGTFDELGQSDVEAAVQEVLALLPTDVDYEAHLERRRASRDGQH